MSPNERVVPVPIEEEMRKSYLAYAMSVIVGRALPDIRDGLKPVHRRVLYTMQSLGLAWNRAYKKSAKGVGEGLGKYHPHCARLAKIPHAMLADIDKGRVDFVPNFDESEQEPTVLPTRLPNLLVNGSSG